MKSQKLKKATFECEVNHVRAQGVWLKDQKPIREVDLHSGRVRFIDDGLRRGIMINDSLMCDIGEYEYRVDQGEGPGRNSIVI